MTLPAISVGRVFAVLGCIAIAIGGCARAPAPVAGEHGAPLAVAQDSASTPEDLYEGAGAMATAMGRYAEALRLTRDRGEYETSEEYAGRRAEFDALRPELRTLEERRFLLTFDVGADPYDPDEGVFRLRVSRPGLLAPAYAEVAADRLQARRMKASLSQAYGVAVLRSGRPHIQKVWIKTASGHMPVVFPSAWTPGPLYAAGGPVRWLDFSPAGDHLAAADVSGPTHLWDLLRSSHVVYDIPVEAPRTREDHPNVVAFAPDSTTLVLGTHNAGLGLWETATHGLTRLPAGHSNQLSSVRFNAAGDQFVSASIDTTWRTWSYPKGSHLPGHGALAAGIHDAVFLPGTELIATCDGGGAVRGWDARTGAEHALIYQGDVAAYALAASTRLPLLAVGFGGNGGIVVVSTDHGQVVRAFPKATPHVSSLVFAPDGHTLIATTSQAGIAVYDVLTGETLQTPADGTASVRSVALSRSGWLAASGADDGRVRLWRRVGADIPPIEPTAPPDAVVVSAADEAHEVLDAMVTAAETVAAQADVEEALSPPRRIGPKTYALIVGVDEYDSFAGLVNPVADAEAVEKELRENYGVETLLLANATRAGFLTQLHAVAARDYEPDDQLLVFLSGHGWFDDVLKRGYLAMGDTAPLDQDRFRDTFVSHEDVRAILERLDCRHVLLVVDSCFSGTLDPSIAMATSGRASGDVMYEGIPRDEYIARKMEFATRRYITAGGKEFVPDGRPGEHSPFARQLLAALRNLGGDDGILTFEEIVLYLERVEPQPLSGELLGNEPGSSFILVTQTGRTETPATSFGVLDLTVTPPGATVSIHRGGAEGYSAPRSLRVEPLAETTRRYRLPTGSYRLRVSHPGYSDDTREVAIVEGEQTLEIALPRTP